MTEVFPRLTLGILNFESCEFLRPLFSSIVSQTEKNFSLCIIDNGSSDGSWELIQELANDLSGFLPQTRISTIRNPQNTFSAHGTKQLFKLCQTPYMSIIHSDDILSPNYVQSALAVIDKSPNISAFNVELTEINEEGIATGDLQSSIWTCSDRVNRLLASGLNSGVMPGSIIKLNSVSSFMKTEFPSQLNGNEDTLLWLSILRSGGKIRKVPLNIYFYRRHPKQTTNSSDAFAFSLGYSRRFNIITSRNFVEKLLALSEIRHEFDYVKNRNYLHGLSLNRPFTFSKFRVFSVVLRRISKFIRWICKYQSK